MVTYAVSPPAQPAVAISGSAHLYPIRRIFCVGRNYAAHAAEMGATIDRSAPFYFTKTPHHVQQAGGQMPYPPGTQDLHHEVELVVALRSGGRGISTDEALTHIFGYGVGLDMTRRDLQAVAKDKRRPWDTGKDFENAAILAPLQEGSEMPQGEISLSVNGSTVQSAPLMDMVWSVPELIAHLSGLYALGEGDLIMTGTPAGVGAVKPGDRLAGRAAGLPALEVEITPPE